MASNFVPGSRLLSLHLQLIRMTGNLTESVCLCCLLGLQRHFSTPFFEDNSWYKCHVCLCRDPMSVQDALDVWGYVEPYLSKLAEQDSDQFESCEELLSKLSEIIPPPPEELLMTIGPDKLLNATDSADTLTESPQWMSPDFPERLEALEGLKFRCFLVR